MKNETTKKESKWSEKDLKARKKFIIVGEIIIFLVLVILLAIVLPIALI